MSGRVLGFRHAARARALRGVLALLDECDADRNHPRQVARLALSLFDELRPLHGLGARERFWLECAALLHDIGRIKGESGHHKVALQIILHSPLLSFDLTTRRIVGCIARYHRKALPHPEHRPYAQLGRRQRRIVRRLAAMLRVADALDRRHEALVDALQCEVKAGKIVGRCELRALPGARRRLASRALAKGKLLESVFERKFAVKLKVA